MATITSSLNLRNNDTPCLQFPVAIFYHSRMMDMQ